MAAGSPATSSVLSKAVPAPGAGSRRLPIAPVRGSRPELVELLGLAARGHIVSRITTYSLEDPPDTHAALQTGNVEGRAVVVPVQTARSAEGEPANEPPQISQDRRWRTARLAGVEVLYGAIAAALGGVFISVFADRYPVATRAFVWFGVLLITVSLAWFALLSLWAPVIVVALVMVLNWGVAVSHTTSADRAKPGTGWALGVWQEEAESLRSLGWIHRGTWIMDVGRVTPAFTVFERPDDRTRVGMMGTAPHGGVISIDTLLDEGRGVLITLRNRSSLLRPPWMFRQELARPLSELIAAHDEALFLLQANGITAGGTVPGDALEFEKYSNRKLRRHMFRRWWLWALRPIVIRLARSTRRPLFEQIHMARQITRYRKAIDREPPLVTRPSAEGRPGRKDD